MSFFGRGGLGGEGGIEPGRRIRVRISGSSVLPDEISAGAAKHVGFLIGESALEGEIEVLWVAVNGLIVVSHRVFVVAVPLINVAKQSVE